jgi:hypothetical protein
MDKLCPNSLNIRGMSADQIAVAMNSVLDSRTSFGTNVFVPLSTSELDTVKSVWPELKNAVDNRTVTVNVKKNPSFDQDKLGLSFVYVTPRSMKSFVWEARTSQAAEHTPPIM